MNISHAFKFLFIQRKEAAVEMEGSFIVRLIYDDDISYALVGAASKVLSMFMFDVCLLKNQDILYM